jgi:TatD DNase family protein
MFDICVNLDSDRFTSDQQVVLERAFQSGVSYMALTGSNLTSSSNILEFCKKDPKRLCCTAGIHPHDADSFSQTTWPAISHLAKNPLVKAVGECGLDFNRQFSASPQQEECFKAHLSLAEKIQKPLFLHQRDAFDTFITIVEDFSPTTPMVVHCFTDSKRELKRLLDNDCYIGITGWICDDRRNQQLLEAVRYIPLDRLMIETDAPWLIPRTLKKVRRNEPAFLIHVAKRLAQEMGIELNEVISKTTDNAKRFFRMR